MAPEAIFRPELVDVETEGISDVVFNCIQVRSIPHKPIAPSLYQQGTAVTSQWCPAE